MMSFHLQEAGTTEWRPLAEGVKRRALEDPVKNGACLRHVIHRRWIKMPSSPFRVRKGPE